VYISRDEDGYWGVWSKKPVKQESGDWEGDDHDTIEGDAFFNDLKIAAITNKPSLKPGECRRFKKIDMEFY